MLLAERGLIGGYLFLNRKAAGTVHENPYKSPERSDTNSSEVDEPAPKPAWFVSGVYSLLSVFFVVTAFGFVADADQLAPLLLTLSCGFVAVVFARRAARS